MANSGDDNRSVGRVRKLKESGEEIGFKWVESAPLVRSSYHAAEQVRALSFVHRKLYGETENS